jgi:hypothetical protein
MNRARAKRLEQRWRWYLKRLAELNAGPLYPSWERDYNQWVAMDYRQYFRRNP